MLATVPALSVSAIFYLYRAACRVRLERQRQLRERVVFMLWAAANLDEGEEPAAVACSAAGGADDDE